MDTQAARCPSVFATLLAFALSGSPALADDFAQQRCEKTLASAEADDGHVDLVAEDVIIDRVRLETSSRSRFISGGPYVQKETRVNRGGREMVFEHTYDCEEGALVLKSSVPLDDTLPTTRWKPGVPMLKFPLTAGSTWSYDGTHVDVIYGSDSKAAANVSGTIDGYETLELPDGRTVTAVHARVVMEWGKKDARESIVQDTWYTLDPLRVVKRTIRDTVDRRTIELDYDPPEGTPVDTPKTTDDGKMIIKIKGSIE